MKTRVILETFQELESLNEYRNLYYTNSWVYEFVCKDFDVTKKCMLYSLLNDLAISISYEVIKCSTMREV